MVPVARGVVLEDGQLRERVIFELGAWSLMRYHTSCVLEAGPKARAAVPAFGYNLFRTSS